MQRLLLFNLNLFWRGNWWCIAWHGIALHSPSLESIDTIDKNASAGQTSSLPHIRTHAHTHAVVVYNINEPGATTRVLIGDWSVGTLINGCQEEGVDQAALAPAS